MVVSLNITHTASNMTKSWHASSVASRGRHRTASSLKSCTQPISVPELDSYRLDVVMKNTTTHCRHPDPRIGDQGSTTALVFQKISLYPPHPPHSVPSPPTLHFSLNVMAHPTHLLMTQHASTDSFRCEGTVEISPPPPLQ